MGEKFMITSLMTVEEILTLFEKREFERQVDPELKKRNDTRR